MHYRFLKKKKQFMKGALCDLCADLGSIYITSSCFTDAKPFGPRVCD